MATVIRLRSRLLRSGCSQTSPNSTSSRSCPSLGTNSYTVGFFCAMGRSPLSLGWYDGRSALVLDDEHHEFRRLRTAGVPVNGVHIVGCLIEGLSRRQGDLLS